MSVLHTLDFKALMNTENSNSLDRRRPLSDLLKLLVCPVSKQPLRYEEKTQVNLTEIFVKILIFANG